MRTITSPVWSPALAAGVPGRTWVSWTPVEALAMPTPRYACWTFPLVSSCETIDLTVFDGTAKPIPVFSPVLLLIWELMPIARPDRSRRGPPELPWLMAASVWIESAIVKLFGAVISRCSALMIPSVRVSSRPYGLPIATTVWPTWSALESPSSIGCRIEGGAFTLITATSVDGSVPTTLPLYVAPFQNRTEIEFEPSTTCSLVMMCPELS
jgi:hypothetical protein